MPTSSITKNFVIKGRKRVKMFANAIEAAYQDSLKREEKHPIKINRISDPDEIKKYFGLKD